MPGTISSTVSGTSTSNVGLELVPSVRSTAERMMVQALLEVYS